MEKSSILHIRRVVEKAIKCFMKNLKTLKQTKNQYQLKSVITSN